MKTPIAFLFLAVAQLALGAEKLALEVYHLVPATKSRPEEGRFILKLVNLSDAPLYFVSHSLTSPLTTVERKKRGAWVTDQRFICGTGMESHVILPRSYVVFDESSVFYPPLAKGEPEPPEIRPKLPSEPVRIRFTCYEDTEGKKPVEAVTREFAPAEFVKK